MDNNYLLSTYRELITSFGEDTVKPPEYVAQNAKRGLEIRESLPDSQKCCTRVGLARAHQLAKMENISIKTLKRMKSFLSRHGATIPSGEVDLNTKLSQSILIWGAYPSKEGIEKVIKWIDSIIE